ncbi:MAG TPA: Cys/Met metabolism pyridoxal-phosphate-dependent enzyme [Cyanobacteria bacterium UBA8156]|jgi:dTDP-4-amino-4,6-dideoxygalactose transaminase|nr:Cys/Met metabolism pyridoxal-phosphate-dependent enzyme [Cyanobacteria bacterium UBA8156]
MLAFRPIPPFNNTVQYAALAPAIEAAVREVLASGQYIGGAQVQAFEQEFAAYNGSAQAIACHSGTDALVLALRALGIGPGDEVITVPFTFFATVEAVYLVGAQPVLVDVEPHTFNLNPAAVAAAVTPRTKAILPVHLFGRSAAMDAVGAIADKYGLFVIEDCAQATGALYPHNLQKVGSGPHFGCFSFYPTKNLGACGDGGLITTTDADLAQRVRELREHGSPRRYYHTAVGYNSRLDALQAAILRIKLPHLDTWIAQRQAIARRYTALLADIPGLVVPADGVGHTWNQYVVRILGDRRDAVQTALQEQGIRTIVYYPLPVHFQAACTDLGLAPGGFPVAEALAQEVLALPMFPELTDGDVVAVAAALREILLG